MCLLAMMLFNACTEEEMPASSPKAEVYVNITLSVGGGMSSRTTPDAPKDYISMGGDESFEYAIAPDDVDILLFTKGTDDNGGNGTFVERVNVVPYWVSQGASDGDRVYYYQLTGSVTTLTEDDLNNKYQLMVIANMGEQVDGSIYTTDLDGTVYGKSYISKLEKEKTTRNDFIAQLVYHGYSNGFTEKLRKGEARIPMWGIKEITLTQNLNSCEVDMLRAMAKVRVTISDDLYDKGYRFTWAGMHKTHTYGYMAAQNSQAVWNNNSVLTTNYNNTSHTGIENPSIPTAQAAHSDSIAEWYGFQQVDTHKSHVIYLPEFKNMNESAQTAIRLQIKYIDSDDDWLEENQDKVDVKFNNEYPNLYFADYSTGTNPTANEWDIIRNDFYDYTITGIAETGELQANVRVMPWNYEKMEYVLSQSASVELTSAPLAVSLDGGSTYTNETLYDEADTDASLTSNYALFQFKVTEPEGVRWTAHLTDNTNFRMIGTTEGVGGVKKDGSDKIYTIMVVPKEGTANNTATQLYFTIETLGDEAGNRVDITYSRTDVDNRDYGISDKYISITKVAEKTIFEVNVAFNHSAEADTTTLGLSTYPSGMVTVNVFNPSSNTSNNKFNNGVVMTAFNNNLYCMWQTSEAMEDTKDTYVAYSSYSVANENAITTHTQNGWGNNITELYNEASDTDDYYSSAGWWVNGNTLVAYINAWKPSTYSNRGGYTQYRTTTDGSNWTEIATVKMADGSDLDGIFEQDPHLITLPNGKQRIVNSAHFKKDDTGGLMICPIYTDDLSGTSGWKKAEFNYHENGYQSREMEPSIFQQANGTLVMVFRDNLKEDNTYSYKLFASISLDYGETWTKPVLTDMRDCKAKQCAGNLPDGTAYIINCPTTTSRRCPLVITLSKDGRTFSKAYLIRSGEMLDEWTWTNNSSNQWDGVKRQRWEFWQKTSSPGFNYPKAMIHNGYLYVSYATNKEDVEYTRIPLSSIQLND